MENILFIISMVAFGGAIVVFMASILNLIQRCSKENKSYEGIIKRFLRSKLTKSSLGLFGLYVVSYAGYIFTQL